MAKGVSTVRQTSGPPQSAGYVPPQRQPVFSRSGEAVDALNEESPPFVFILSGHLVRMVAALRVAGSSPTTISIRLDGTEIATITIPANEKSSQILLDQPFTEAEQLTVAITNAGTGATDLTVIGDPR